MGCHVFSDSGQTEKVTEARTRSPAGCVLSSCGGSWWIQREARSPLLLLGQGEQGIYAAEEGTSSDPSSGDPGSAGDTRLVPHALPSPLG